ncbi:2-C-methyl-D-erythritol 2,4-cyclodiphosphate synthase [Ileibacterium valens]|uniref:2-C-methyl-D-erythritol 2,4-cyclodiphosphate synthase n=1 Tax=Ileibacterium valens TaxID=1862668 RepID=A0A1U7NCZ2_9FIRM|nr:2-C-methyl-D-erythritol 2,4-cyclodiphosphate synthase [Ileibacterium valens]OLU36724.1 2-C-methyl-D-erythritol 2,4-cyclodiphosphate synthase [Ileibacterium valens]OLU39018.1 2-C-methyl-D-erythritol 2,4-cyclodiphosphate synthase [Erysipelotrichaceae bacterium NYU-BL-F16]OLU41217.1 2-C-methyl-D-erythritol 2,4-cyclodiphosphate synthase [Erysipelotrichaceae bacterium NYU-BL-E8]
MIRIGQSIDIHQLVEGRPLILGGVSIPFEKGLLGHSDADVLLHAIAESILGALALGDLGHHFPDTDPAYKGMDSKEILKRTVGLMEDEGYRIGNLDATVLAEKPKLKDYVESMRYNVAQIAKCDLSQVSIKATRGEKMGFVGRQEGIAALCVCLLTKKDDE